MTEPATRPLAGRVALVTGGTRGIGLACAQALAVDGATVVVTGRDEATAAKVAGDLAAAHGVTAEGVGLDVAEFGAVADAVKGVASRHGGLDVLVANAGSMESGLVGMIREDHVRRMLDVNVAGTIASVQAAARVMMRRKSGSMVLLSSVVGEYGSAGQMVYAAAKAAVANLARSAAKELGPRGIRVNAVAPGVISTDLIADLSSEVLERQTAATPLRRLGTAVDVARVVRFLAGDDAAFVTGQVLGVDGGLVL